MRNGRSRIPVDVVLEILGHLGPPLTYTSLGLQPTMNAVRYRTLRNLALVCREYHYHTLPFLFEIIYIDLSPDEVREGPLHFYTRFYRSIVDGDERARTLATHVRTCVIDSSISLNRLDCALPYKVLEFLPNLRELHGYCLSITNDFLSAAASLPPLQVLRIEECTVPELLDKSSLKTFADLHVTHMYHTISDEPEEEIQITQLVQHYPISHIKSLTSRSRIDFYFLNGLITSHSPMNRLEHITISSLECNEEYPTALSDFLKVVPVLKTLHIEEFLYQIDDVEDFDIVPCTTYTTPPNLEHLHASLPALKAMIPGSSVSSIGIAREDTAPDSPMPIYGDKGPRFWAPYAEAFTKSLKPIVSMDVPMDLYTSLHFAKYFPALRTLTVRPKHWNWYNVDAYVWDDADLALDSGPDEVRVSFCEFNSQPVDIVTDQFQTSFSRSWHSFSKRGTHILNSPSCSFSMTTMNLHYLSYMNKPKKVTSLPPTSGHANYLTIPCILCIKVSRRSNGLLFQINSLQTSTAVRPIESLCVECLSKPYFTSSAMNCWRSALQFIHILD